MNSKPGKNLLCCAAVLAPDHAGNHSKPGLLHTTIRLKLIRLMANEIRQEISSGRFWTKEADPDLQLLKKALLLKQELDR